MRALLPLLGGCEEPPPPEPPPEDDIPVMVDDDGLFYTSLCEASDTQAIVSLGVTDGQLSNARQLDVTLAKRGRVIALCSSPDDPSEHLVESPSADTVHALQFSGLLPETEYTCKVAPLCPFAEGASQQVTIQTGPGPDLPHLQVEVDAALGMTGYWTLLQFVDGACVQQGPNWLVLYDGRGVARWWYQLPNETWIAVESLYHSDEDVILWGGGYESSAGRPRRVDLWEGDVWASTFPGWQQTRFSHDAKRMADGRLLMLDYRDMVAGDLSWWGFGVRVQDPLTGDIALDLSSQRYVDEGWLRTPEEVSPGGEDIYHANWVDWVEHPDGDRLYVSLCYDRSVLALDAATGDVRYKLARGEGWTVLDEQGQELPEDELPQCQHGNEVVGDDVLLLYDNGRDSDRSRVVELAVDPDARTVTRRWQWTEPQWHESTLGDVDDLGNGRVLVTEAHPECWSTLPGDRSAIVEVDRATGQVASRLTFPEEAHTLYRSERYNGCALMSSTLACPDLARRAEYLEERVGW